MPMPYMMYGEKGQYFPPYFPPGDNKYGDYYYPMPMKQYSPHREKGDKKKDGKDRQYNPY